MMRFKTGSGYSMMWFITGIDFVTCIFWSYLFEKLMRTSR